MTTDRPKSHSFNTWFKKSGWQVAQYLKIWNPFWASESRFSSNNITSLSFKPLSYLKSFIYQLNFTNSMMRTTFASREEINNSRLVGKQPCYRERLKSLFRSKGKSAPASFRVIGCMPSGSRDEDMSKWEGYWRITIGSMLTVSRIA